MEGTPGEEEQNRKKKVDGGGLTFGGLIEDPVNGLQEGSRDRHCAMFRAARCPSQIAPYHPVGVPSGLV